MTYSIHLQLQEPTSMRPYPWITKTIANSEPSGSHISSRANVICNRFHCPMLLNHFEPEFYIHTNHNVDNVESREIGRSSINQIHLGGRTDSSCGTRSTGIVLGKLTENWMMSRPLSNGLRYCGMPSL